MDVEFEVDVYQYTVYITVPCPATDGRRLAELWNDMCTLLNWKDELQRHRAQQESVCYAPVRSKSPVPERSVLFRAPG